MGGSDCHHLYSVWGGAVTCNHCWKNLIFGCMRSYTSRAVCEVDKNVPGFYLFFFESERSRVVGRDGPAVRVVISVVRGDA